MARTPRRPRTATPTEPPAAINVVDLEKSYGDAPALDPVTRQLRVTVRVPNAAGRLPAGAWAEGTLLGGSAATGGGR